MVGVRLKGVGSPKQQGFQRLADRQRDDEPTTIQHFARSRARTSSFDAAGVLCRPPVAREDEWGREQPPDFADCPVPRTAPGVAHAPVSMSRITRKYSSDLRAVCACVVTCVRAADRARIAQHFRHTFCDEYSRASAIISSASSCARPRQGSSLRSDPLCGPAGLDDTCAQLEGSTYVMAEEARRIFPY